MIPGVAHRRQFRNLSEQEVLALAISSEEDDGRIYRWYAQRLAPVFRSRREGLRGDGRSRKTSIAPR